MKKAPIFVKIDEYKEVLDILSLLKEKVHNAHELLAKVQKVKAREDAEIAKWQTNLTDIDQKVSEIDKTLFEVENL